MNEKIKQLMQQTCKESIRPESVLEDVPQDVLEKFAELIVRECMDLASAEQKRYASITHRNMSECAVALGNFSLLMEDHFGVEK